MHELSIVILTYNSSSYIFSCLESIFNLYKKEVKSGSFEIIVVDNESKDDTEDKVYEFKRKYFEGVTFIQNGGNLGFAAGIDRGMENVKSKYSFFLNPDATISNRGLIKMIEYFKSHPSVKVLGGRLVDFSGKSELSAGKFMNAFRLVGWMLGLENVLQYRYAPKKIKKVDFVSGGAMMVDTQYFQKSHGFDQNFFMYVEDMEFCYRVKKNKYQVYYFPQLEVRHKGQGSSNSSFAYVNIFKGFYLFHKKHSSKIVLFFVQLILFLKCIIAIVVGGVTMNKTMVQTYKNALRFAK